MSNGQNTGRRYIPKFFTYDGSTEWRPNVAYSAKTIVTKNFKVYTSIVNVPSNVGEPEDNPKYWQAAVITDEVMQTIIDELGKLDGDVSVFEHRIEVLETEVGELQIVLAGVQEEVEQLQDNLITDSASGAIASFPDGGEGFAVRGLKVQMEPIQDLHGQSSPYPAGGGKNKIDASNVSVPTNLDDYAVIAQSIILPAGTYTLSWTLDKNVSAERNRPYCTAYGASGAIYSQEDSKTAGRHSWTFTLEEEKNLDFKWWYHTVSEACTISDFQLEVGSTATSYAPYSNVCPISGRDSVTVTRTGFNVWDEEWEEGIYDNTNGEKVAISNRIRSKNHIPCNPNTAYYYKYGGSISGIKFRICYYDADKLFISTDNDKSINSAYTTPSNAHFLTFALIGANISTYNHDISINYPSTDTDYHAGHVQTVEIPLGQTVYGGTLDVTNGVLTVDRAMADLGTLIWSVVNSNFFYATITGMKANVNTEKCSAYATVNAYSDYNFADKSVSISQFVGRVAVHDSAYSDATAFESAMNGVQLCYELAQPVNVQLSAQQMTTLLGQNNVWSDADSVSVDYVADTKSYIAKVIADALT